MEKNYRILAKKHWARNLTQSFINDFYKKNEKSEHNFDGTQLSIDLNISIKTEEICKIEKYHQDLVAARNFIVHNILEKYEFNNVEKHSEIETYLDSEHDKAKLLLNELMHICDFFSKSLKYAMSECCINRIQKFSNADEISRNMASEMIQGLKRDDGWIVLSKASNILREEHPELFVDMKKYGQKSLKKIMDSSGLFEFYSEDTSKGGMRDLFRLK